MKGPGQKKLGLIILLILSLLNETALAEIPDKGILTPEYLKGKKAAWESKYRGSFAAGYLIGMGLPFLISGYIQNENFESKRLTVAGGVATGIIPIWGGYRLLKFSKIKVPSKLLEDYSGQGKEDFTMGYIQTAERARLLRYNLGVAGGVGTTGLVAVMIFGVYWLIIKLNGGIGDWEMEF
jgi:hypothetical protein